MSVDPSSSDNFELEKKYEHLVGIDHFTTDISPIGGKIKQDVSDFIVREIMPSREILRTWEKTQPELDFESKKDQYTHFTVIKRNMDTIIAANIIQDYLKIPENSISWAGIKDNFAITAQRFSIKGNFIKSLKKFKHRNIEITDIRPAERPVLIGQLWGNNFAINIRNTIRPFVEIQSDIEKWKTQIQQLGFPNYFGLQRFGHHRPNSHLVAKFLLAEDYKAAVEEYLFHIYPKEFPEIAEFRQKMQKGPMDETILENFPSALTYERKIVQALVKKPDDYRNAMLHLPKSLLHLILSSFQSYIFNKAISIRAKHGFSISQPIKGDVVSILLEPFGHPSYVNYRFGNWHDEFILKAIKLNRATIVAPIIGYKTKLEDFSAFEPIYKEILHEEDFKPSVFNSIFVSEIEFEGTIRPIIQKPSGLTISQAHLIGKPSIGDPNGIFLEFSLPKGTYATMLIRELIKYPEKNS